jgi:hypothetical protein
LPELLYALAEGLVTIRLFLMVVGVIEVALPMGTGTLLRALASNRL